jgi:hypothetical protein
MPNRLTDRFKHSRLAGIYPTILGWYLLCFMVFALLSFLGPVLYFERIQSLCAYPFAAAGLLLLAVDLLLNRSLCRVPHYRWLLLFLAITVISMVMASAFGWLENLKTLIWLLIQCGLMVPLVYILGQEEGKRWFKRAFWAVFAIASIACLISCIEFILQITYFLFSPEGRVQRQGYFDGRLFGIFNSPNYGAVLSVTAVVLACYYLIKPKVPRWQRCVLFVGGIVNLLYLGASNSRIGFICLIAVLLIGAFFWIWNKRQSASGKATRNALLISLALVCGVSAAFVAFDRGCSAYAAWAHEADPFGFVAWSNLENRFYADRIDNTLDNLSNNRFAIWKDYLVFTGESPLFGKSPSNLYEINTTLHPDSFIIQRHYHPHSGYVYVFAATGVLGFSCWVALAFFFIKECVSYVRKKGVVSQRFILASCLFAIVLIMTVTNETIFFGYGFDSFIFYISLGWFFKTFASECVNVEKVRAHG